VQPATDLRVLPFIAHKRYLVRLADAGLDVVPTSYLPAGTTETGLHAARNALHSRCPALMRDGAYACVVKPAVGGGGDGVELLRDGDRSGECALLRLLARRDMVLQPFLPRVQTAGEMAFVFVNEKFLHAVLKDPTGWGSTQSVLKDPSGWGGAQSAGQQDSGSGEYGGDGGGSGGGRDAEGCSRHGQGGDDLHFEAGDGLRTHAAAEQPIRRLDPPAEALATARRALHAVRKQACAEDDAPIYLARVDLLPTCDGNTDQGGALRWLVSEIELGWPHLFLRGAYDDHGDGLEVRPVACIVAEGLLEHLNVPTVETLAESYRPQAAATNPGSAGSVGLEGICGESSERGGGSGGSQSTGKGTGGEEPQETAKRPCKREAT